MHSRISCKFACTIRIHKVPHNMCPYVEMGGNLQSNLQLSITQQLLRTTVHDVTSSMATNSRSINVHFDTVFRTNPLPGLRYLNFNMHMKLDIEGISAESLSLRERLSPGLLGSFSPSEPLFLLIYLHIQQPYHCSHRKPKNNPIPL